MRNVSAACTPPGASPPPRPPLKPETRIAQIYTNAVSDLLYKDECYQLVGFCMEIHRELGRGLDEVVYKDAMCLELQRANFPFSRERRYDISYKGVTLPHQFFADFVVWDKIIFEAKAVERLTDAHIKQVLNYLAIAKLQLGLLVNFGSASLEWKRVVL
jgi:GxxExxY protein